MVDASSARTWSAAVTEWQVVGLEEDPAGTGVCVCGQQNLVKLFTIANTRNSAILHPIGSTCINHFEQSDLNQQVDVLHKLLVLRAAFLARKPVSLTADFFSRAVPGRPA